MCEHIQETTLGMVISPLCVTVGLNSHPFWMASGSQSSLELCDSTHPKLLSPLPSFCTRNNSTISTQVCFHLHLRLPVHLDVFLHCDVLQYVEHWFLCAITRPQCSLNCA